MPRYRIYWTETKNWVALIEAESESAARQSWIDNRFVDLRLTNTREEFDSIEEVEP